KENSVQNWRSDDDDKITAVSWHYDSYPSVVVTTLSDCRDMGTAVVMQGRYIEHQALKAFGDRKRISMVTSFRAKSPHEYILQPPSDFSSPGYDHSDTRPYLCIQFYDTNPGSGERGHLKALAESLRRETCKRREAHGRGILDRIEVWGMPLAAELSDDVKPRGKREFSKSYAIVH
ncbi:hypothetical protein CI238_05854, partial [Colletotrichum incanum]